VRAARRRPARAGLVVALVAVLLAACTGGGATPDGTTDGTPTADPGPQPEDVVASEVVVTSEAEVRVDVHPVVRAGDLAVLTLDLVPPDPLPGTGRVHVHGWDVDGLTYHLTSEAPSNVRLVDLVRDVVLHGGTDAAGSPVVAPEGWATLRDPAGTRLQIPFAAPHPDADEVALFLPGAPLVAAVPVIDGEVPVSVRPVSAAASTGTPGAATGSASPTSAPEVLDLDAVVAAPVFPLESTSIELAGAVTTVESQERVDVSLGSDVLFEFDQDVLTPAADEALRLVAQRLTERAPGDVTVVGHTDDQGDEAYNADLSQRRARTVADALGALVDPGSYPMAVEGRGESEPVVPNTSDEDRARNRRVTVTLTSTMVTRTELTTGGELPPFGPEGQVGTAGTPLPVEALIDWELEATARRVHGHVVVDLVARNVDDRSSSGAKIGSLDGGDRGRGEGTTAPSASSSGTILHGATRVLPLDYRTGVSERHPGGEWFALADLTVGGAMDPGQARTFSFVYPELDVDTVTFQAGTGRGSWHDFRILDIPVARGDDATG